MTAPPSSHRYDSEVAPHNKFGHCLELLERNLGVCPEDSVVLDLACGFGHIAEAVRDRFDLGYIGVDVDGYELGQVRARGLEAHDLDLCSPDVEERLRKILDGRTLAAVTFLDGLEHLTTPTHVLRALGALLAEHRAIAVTSVPNVTHIDVAVKALLGRWDYTDAGLLDRTHYQLFSEQSLLEGMRASGLRRIDEHNVVLGRSDQWFPEDHVALSERASVAHWLRAVRERAEPNLLVNQFVWALTSAPAQERPRRTPTESPFLSVIMRTQGRREQELREAMLSLAAQSEADFEVLVVAHKTSLAEQKSVEQVIADQPPSFRERIRLLLLDRGRRSTPLNVALAEARGRYVGIFDDDDHVTGGWVEHFARAAQDNPGKVLRAVALRQNVEITDVRGERAVRAVGAPAAVYAKQFSMTQHLVENQSPPIGWVFPRSLFTDFGLAFDESMTTTEDWDFLLRAAELCGVTDIEEVTAIYRWWESRESSRTVHPMDEWAQNQGEIERRTDARPFLLPAGETRILRRQLIRLRDLEALHRQREREVARLERQLRRAQQRNDKLRSRLGEKRQALRGLRSDLRAARRKERAVPGPPEQGLRRRARRLLRRA